MEITAGRTDFKRLFDGRGIIIDPEEGTSILIQGEAGLGKTTLALQLSTQLILNSNFKCIYYTFDQRPKNLKLMIESFNFLGENETVMVYDWHKNISIETSTRYNIINANNDNFSDLSLLMDDIKRITNINNQSPFIVVLDSIGAIKGLNKLERKEVTRLIDAVKDSNAVLILVREKNEVTMGELSEHITTVVLDLHIQRNNGDSSFPRTVMEIKKSRNQSANRGPHEYLISTPSDADMYLNGIDPEIGGITFFPSIRTVSGSNFIIPNSNDTGQERANFGLPKLDEMFSGYKQNKGIPYGQSILLNGKPGNHKTELGLQFLDQSTENESCLFISFKVEKDALNRIKFIDNDLLNRLIFINAKIPFQTPAIVLARIRNAVERANKKGKPIKRAIVFGIGMLDYLAMFQKKPLTFLQVLLYYFRKEQIANILIDWPQPHNTQRLTLHARDLVSTEIFLETENDENFTNMKLLRIDYHFVNLIVGKLINNGNKIYVK